MPESDYVTVHDGAVTNTTPGSKVYVVDPEYPGGARATEL
jgi:hypothetical protein